MKKLIRSVCSFLCILLITVTLSGCILHLDTPDEKDVAFKKEWGYSATVHKGEAIPDEETAIAVATTYMEELYDSRTSDGTYHYSSAEYRKDKEAWIVSFLPENGNESAVCNIFLSREDGCVLAIAWGKYTG